jgi:hypothetical protein
MTVYILSVPAQSVAKHGWSCTSPSLHVKESQAVLHITLPCLTEFAGVDLHALLGLPVLCYCIM